MRFHVSPHHPDVAWRKSSYTAENGTCVEVAAYSTQIAARDSKFPAGGMLVMDRTDWQGLLASLRA
ncbi:uncharacterized protein DUF397 [Stackebrandtia albiflava]|uniref:Uncharacterized protein DUF397 n=1 Tax=Stackebrandtia albiflava TaxID=406432 RepID=A0A562UL91_9ACTN|nr:DUF397 domain-containing protein [Stackebrandtia albiflava]TWJ06377.1 uncharacterized protein DUF397 [Stackebrandtia albiflava]